ncbi:P-loop containing nucleoside triphosphate hydrolase protein [Trematosphaeria pertusa]|uniref:P-loop containing nucleoside triphosphate hydrolase protein n=1 Tax=Trematosphaeria pertusa TaxID=390896 RepID=A0A6A6IEX6_9PLEO|nr:P-loop containing nucleoside triphosphate hydrolase protein [Trematosphaeria pertusa]KAF2249135.1 P-loop containing nucleoside triphosphate hydrolase protein [Trematosphaeria pertusa]
MEAPPTQGIKRRHSDRRLHDGAKRARNDVASNANGVIEPRFLIVHQVTCTRHPDHRDALYADTPRLFAGDSRTVALHGRTRINQDIFSEEFAEDNPNISFNVVKSYDCGQYHDLQLARDAFRTLPMPDGIAKALGRFKSQLTFLDDDGPEADVVSEKIYFIAKELKDAMKDCRARYPQYFIETELPDSQDAPYLGMYHARTLMANEILQPTSWLPDMQRAHTACLMNFIQTSRAQEYAEADHQFAAGVVTKRHFAKLFAPDDIIVRTTDEGPLGYMVSGFPQNSDLRVGLSCWNWEFDGRFFRKRSNWTVEWPSSEHTIHMSSLSIYPLKFDQGGVKERLYSRGQQFWKCRKQRLVECDSLTLSFEFRATCNRFMIDLNTYRQMHPEAIEDHANDGNGVENEESPPEDGFLLLLPATIRGYGFHDKKWSKLPVEQIRDVDWSSDTFDRRLVLKPRKKELIKALVTIHTSKNKPQKADIIEGKGKGLILLLHGGPGTGKTLTAESIAEYAKRPLYRVTCGDIGTDPESVEKYLESVLYIGTIWRCVVLLDEGDVFLEERTPTDLQRNALVSVFLRTLEYFEGILILTSNRVGTFDEAFKSRVQLAMHYPPLDRKDRLEVWDMFFRDMLEAEEKVKEEELSDKLNMLAQHKLNGRQIRNVINTARQLARYRKEILAYTHIDQALEVANEFEEYITGTRGHTDEEYAKAEGIR